MVPKSHAPLLASSGTRVTMQLDPVELVGGWRCAAPAREVWEEGRKHSVLLGCSSAARWHGPGANRRMGGVQATQGSLVRVAIVGIVGDGNALAVTPGSRWVPVVVHVERPVWLKQLCGPLLVVGTGGRRGRRSPRRSRQAGTGAGCQRSLLQGHARTGLAARCSPRARLLLGAGR